ncbi:MAG: hypothetical protein RI956_658 [Pseudomonadota bacterium]|jgi:hypothetical protein
MKNTHTFITSTVLASLVFAVPAWSKPQPIVKKSAISKKQTKATKKAKPIKKIIPIVPTLVEQDQDIQQISRWVVSGQYNCFGQKTITLTPRIDYPGYVDVQQNGKTHLFLAVTSNTGAVRLENKAANLFWLQLPVKSMLFNSQTGSRVLDDCQPETLPSILDVPATALKSKASLLITDTPILPINTPTDVAPPLL